MDLNNKIPIDFARSTARKIEVRVSSIVDYETLTNLKVRSYKRREGTIKPILMPTIVVTILILLSITFMVKLFIDG